MKTDTLTSGFLASLNLPAGGDLTQFLPGLPRTSIDIVLDENVREMNESLSSLLEDVGLASGACSAELLEILEEHKAALATMITDRVNDLCSKDEEFARQLAAMQEQNEELAENVSSINKQQEVVMGQMKDMTKRQDNTEAHGRDALKQLVKRADEQEKELHQMKHVAGVVVQEFDENVAHVLQLERRTDRSIELLARHQNGLERKTNDRMELLALSQIDMQKEQHDLRHKLAELLKSGHHASGAAVRRITEVGEEYTTLQRQERTAQISLEIAATQVALTRNNEAADKQALVQLVRATQQAFEAAQQALEAAQQRLAAHEETASTLVLASAECAEAEYMRLTSLRIAKKAEYDQLLQEANEENVAPNDVEPTMQPPLPPPPGGEEKEEKRDLT